MEKLSLSKKNGRGTPVRPVAQKRREISPDYLSSQPSGVRSKKLKYSPSPNQKSISYTPKMSLEFSKKPKNMTEAANNGEELSHAVPPKVDIKMANLLDSGEEEKSKKPHLSESELDAIFLNLRQPTQKKILISLLNKLIK